MDNEKRTAYYVAHREDVLTDRRTLRLRNRTDLNALKLLRGCSDCGYNINANALEFDHLPGTIKASNVTSLVQSSGPSLRAEIAKCEVVCANCHAIRTASRAKK